MLKLEWGEDFAYLAIHEGVEIKIELAGPYLLRDPLADIDTRLAQSTVEEVIQWVDDDIGEELGYSKGFFPAAPDNEYSSYGNETIIAEAQVALSGGLDAAIKWATDQAKRLEEALG